MELFSGISGWLALVCAVGGYLLGNFQTSIIISKLYYHDDVRAHGSGNAGSTNMVRVFGFRPGILTFIGDFAKAAVAVLLGQWIVGELGGYIAGLCAVIGHCWPVLAGFRGGKGVACTLGVAAMTFPIGALAAVAAAAVLAVLTKKISLASLTGVTAFLLAVLVFRHDSICFVLLAALLFSIVVFRHTDNIKRLIHGEEKPLINS